MSMQRWAYEDHEMYVSPTLGGKGHCAFVGVLKRMGRKFTAACSVLPDSSGGRVELRSDAGSEPVVIRYVAADDSFIIAGQESRPLRRKKEP